MNITGICLYETPCGWCSKWDKKCDCKIGCETHDFSQPTLVPSPQVMHDKITADMQKPLINKLNELEEVYQLFRAEECISCMCCDHTPFDIVSCFKFKDYIKETTQND